MSEQSLPLEEMVRMIREYNLTRVTVADPTRTCWFNLQTITDVICANLDEPDREAIKQQIATSGVSGLRVYYAVYPQDVPEEHFRGKHTLILVATEEALENGNLINRDIITTTENGGGLCPPPKCPGAILLDEADK